MLLLGHTTQNIGSFSQDDASYPSGSECFDISTWAIFFLVSAVTTDSVVRPLWEFENIDPVTLNLR